MRKIWASLNTSPTRSIHLARRGQIVADRLLQHHARFRRHQVGAADIAADRAVQVGRGRQIEHTHARRIEKLPQSVPVGIGPRRVQPRIVQASAEAVHHGGVEIGGGDMVLQRLHGTLAEAVVADVRAGGADDARLRRHLPVAHPIVQRRQQLAQRQVAGGAEYHAVEDRDGNDLGHKCSPSPTQWERVGEGAARLRNTLAQISPTAWERKETYVTPPGWRHRPC